MASLIEELITTLTDEEELYRELLPIAKDKTDVIIKNDLESLNSITEKEQSFVEKISRLEKKRLEVISNIGVVMDIPQKNLNFTTIIKLLEGQEKEQELLRNLHDKLHSTLDKLSMLNNRNQALIEQSLSMIDFDINLIQNIKMSPATGQQYNNYSKMEVQSGASGLFDKKS